MVILPPLFVFEQNSIDIFHNIQDLENKLEPVDVENNAYQAFDSLGNLLELSVISKETRFLWKFTLSVKAVKVSNSYPNHQNDLLEKLQVSYLQYSKQDGSFENMTLKALQEKVIQLCGYTT